MFFFGRRKKYNGSVSALLPAFGIDQEIAGAMKLLNVLDIAWENKYSQYEGALLVAYAFASGLYKTQPERAEEFTDKMMFIQEDWIKKDLVRNSLVEQWYGLLLKRTGRAEVEMSDTVYEISPSMPDISNRKPEITYKATDCVIVFVKDVKTISENRMGQEFPISYHYVMAVLDSINGMPKYFVTLENNSLAAGSFLCVFGKEGEHMNLGSGSDYSDENIFVVKALEIIRQEFGFDCVDEV